MDRGCRIEEVEELYYVAKTKALISCTVTGQLFLVYAKSRVSHDAAHFKSASHHKEAKRDHYFIIFFRDFLCLNLAKDVSIML